MCTMYAMYAMLILIARFSGHYVSDSNFKQTFENQIRSFI